MGRRRARNGVILAVALTAGALAVLPAAAADDDLDLVSRATGPVGAAADGDSSSPRLSSDGSRIVFGSEADNMSADDVNNVSNAFVRDLAAGTTALVSRADGAAGSGTASGGVLDASISGDGTRVAFDGSGAMIEPGLSNLRPIFVRDLTTNSTTPVSRATGPAGALADAFSFQPAISGDGTVVAFQTLATNLSDDDVDGVEDVYARDIATGTTTLLSRASGPGGAGADADAGSPSVSADGRIVAFISRAKNLSADDADATQDVFVRDRATDLTVLVSRATGPSGAAASSDAFTPAVSADGRYVLFASKADNLSPDDADGTGDVFVRDLQANTTTLVSRADGPAGAGGDGDSAWGGLSADGRLAVFHSLATNLSAEDGDGVRDVFVRDIAAGRTVLVSRARGAAGAAGDANSQFPAISADGRRVAFESDADNLSADDVNSVTNIFVRTLPPLAPLGGPAVPISQPAGGGAPRAVSARCAGLRATIVGTARGDVIRGTAKRDVIAALGGNDVVRGLGGDDVICLGPGNDRGDGGAGADRILGGPGRDLMLGGPGRDRLLGQAGRDRARGGAGRDACVVEARTAC